MCSRFPRGPAAVSSGIARATWSRIFSRDPAGQCTEEGPMQGVKDSSGLYEVERRARHAERPGFRINELQISPRQQVPWHLHTNIQDTFYVLEGELRLFLREPKEEVR